MRRRVPARREGAGIAGPGAGRSPARRRGAAEPRDPYPGRVNAGGPTSSTSAGETRTEAAPDRGGIWSVAHRATTVGATGLVFLNAFESLAVTTVMPLVSRELGGGPLYALAFAAPMAVGIVGMVLAGSSA